MPRSPTAYRSPCNARTYRPRLPPCPLPRALSLSPTQATTPSPSPTRPSTPSPTHALTSAPPAPRQNVVGFPLSRFCRELDTQRLRDWVDGAPPEEPPPVMPEQAASDTVPPTPGNECEDDECGLPSD